METGGAGSQCHETRADHWQTGAGDHHRRQAGWRGSGSERASRRGDGEGPQELRAAGHDRSRGQARLRPRGRGRSVRVGHLRGVYAGESARDRGMPDRQSESDGAGDQASVPRGLIGCTGKCGVFLQSPRSGRGPARGFRPRRGVGCHRSGRTEPRAARGGRSSGGSGGSPILHGPQGFGRGVEVAGPGEVADCDERAALRGPKSDGNG